MTPRPYNITLTLCILGFAVLAGAQERAVKCLPNSTAQKAPEYRIGVAGHSIKEACELYIFISVDPGHFVREDMLALANRLNQDFCYEKRLTAVIVDDDYAARHPMRNTKVYRDAERGRYHLNRDSREQYIKFSTARGKPWNEVVIDLNAETK